MAARRGEVSSTTWPPTRPARRAGAAQPALLAELRVPAKPTSASSTSTAAPSRSPLRGASKWRLLRAVCGRRRLPSRAVADARAEGRARGSCDDPAPEPTGGEGSDRRRRPRGGHRRGRRVLEEDRPVPVEGGALPISAYAGLLAWLRPYRILSYIGGVRLTTRPWWPSHQPLHHCRISILWRPLHSPLATMPASGFPQTSASRRRCLCGDIHRSAAASSAAFVAAAAFASRRRRRAEPYTSPRSASARTASRTSFVDRRWMLTQSR